MISARDVVQRLMDEGAEDTLGYKPGVYDPGAREYPLPRERPTGNNPRSAHYAATRSAADAYAHARDVLHGPFPQGEKIIASSPVWALNYAANVLHGPFPAAEPFLLKKPHDIAAYAFALDRRWPEGEAVLKQMAEKGGTAKFWYDGYQRFFADR